MFFAGRVKHFGKLCRDAFLVQLVRLAEDCKTDTEQDDQAANSQILVLQLQTEDIDLNACTDLADIEYTKRK